MRTGDLGCFDKDGYVRILGRTKDMIIRGGENIYPKEIEEFLMKHPDVADVQVIGIADEYLGEDVCAWIKVKGHNHELDSEILAEDLYQYCHGKIAHFKIPRYIKFVKSYPLTFTGKVKKNEMRKISNKMKESKLFGSRHDFIKMKKRHGGEKSKSSEEVLMEGSF